MKKLACVLFFSVFYLLPSSTFAQDSGQSSADSGVLVSPPIQAADKNNGTSNNVKSDALISSNPDTSSNPKPNRPQDADGNASDEIILKSTNAMMLQITENMKLTQDQVRAIEPVIKDTIIRTRDLQLSLEKGTIDGKTMYSQREELTRQENQRLGRILTADQMKVWMNIQNPSN